MIQTFLSWIWIFISAYVLGYAGLYALNRGKDKNRGIDVILLFGLCILTVYAQFFSLFSGVGKGATVVLAVTLAVLTVFLHKQILRSWKIGVKSLAACGKVGAGIGMCVIGVLVLLVALVLTRGAQHYDTYLYHAQSIRWIEEYGVVPGLGNLHSRLAYNSSFFALQALFSFSFLGGNSMYSVNGFVTILMVAYALCSMKVFRVKKLYASDLLRVGLLVFFLGRENYSVIGSPGTDLLAMSLVMYLLIKWMTYWEEGLRAVECYAELCLLAVFGVSVKLSSAMVVLLVVTPAVWLLREKRWADIGKYIACGLLVALPWLIRNVIISGYLIYPYPELDLFAVDWKMPEYTLLFDRNEIKAWGWGVNDVYLSNMHLREWFPIWFGKMHWYMQALFGVNIIMIPVVLVISICEGIKNRQWNLLQIVMTILAIIAVWFVGAPLPRYGFAYMLLLPLLFIGYLLERVSFKALGCYMLRGLAGALMVCVCLVWVNYGTEAGIWRHYQRVFQPYRAYECEGHLLDDSVMIYTPVSGDQTGYYDFPATPYLGRLQLIELRGESLEEGFRIKEEYRDAYVTPGGSIDKENFFEEK